MEVREVVGVSIEVPSDENGHLGMGVEDFVANGLDDGVGRLCRLGIGAPPGLPVYDKNDDLFAL